MPRRRWIVALASLLLLTPVIPHALAQDSNKNCGSTAVRVGLVRSFRGAKQITMVASSDSTIVRAGLDEKLASVAAGAPVKIAISDSRLVLDSEAEPGKTPITSVTVVPKDESGTIDIDSPGLQSRQYRGKIEVSAQGSNLLVVNVLDIEDYLPGVLVGEMPSSFPEEALKAQAVAARCYTLCSLHKHSASGFDLCDSPHCQVFDGCLRENHKIAQAVDETRGQVLTYKGRIASIMYHSDCGGATECYSDAYPKRDFPYLRGVKEPTGVPYSTWEQSYAKSELEAKLVAAGVKEAEGLQQISITKTSSSGRALDVGITGAKVSVTISGSRLRMILGASTLRSTLFTVETDSDGTITFKGKGHGHGIGMSQVGAKALAEAPFNYTYAKILEHYFPGTALSAATPEQKTVAMVAPRPVPKVSASAIQPSKASSQTFDVKVIEPKL